MGFIQKIKSKPNLRTLNLRRKAKSNAAEGRVEQGTSSNIQIWEVKVTSTPKEYSRDATQRFNWLTNKMDDFLSSFQDDVDPADNDAVNAPAKSARDSSETGWGWLSLCWGSPSLAHKPEEDEEPTHESSYEYDDETGDSSQPSISRVDQVLELKHRADDVSDITSVPSDDSGSDTDSDQTPESETDK